MSPSELDPTMKIILQIPIWSQRVIYIQGSALKDGDLSRCRMQDAEACFMIAARNYQDRNAAVSDGGEMERMSEGRRGGGGKGEEGRRE